MDTLLRNKNASVVAFLGALLLMGLLAIVYGNSLLNKTPLSLPSLNTSTAQIGNIYRNLPLNFEKNHGQFSSDVAFLSRGEGYDIFLRKTGTTITLEPSNVAINMDFVGANTNPLISGVDELDGKINYFLGNDPSQWRKNIPTYSKVQYSEVYPGINLIYYGNHKKLEYDFVVSAGVDPANILLNFSDATKVEVSDSGELVLSSGDKELKFNKPILYQEINNQKQEVTGGYMLKDSTTIGFKIGAYDTSKPLIIDPTLDYSTYIGGSSQDQAFDIAVDASGNTYIIGTTLSSNFPTNNQFDSTLGGSADIFITKINPAGTALVYSTYLGGSGSSDEGHAIAVDSSENVYVTGNTNSTNFPVTTIRFQGTKSSGVDSFVTRLDSTGSSLQYSTYLGAGGDDIGNGIAVDASGNAYVTGYTTSSNFPRLNAFQTTRNGSFDSYVTKLNPSGTALIYSTYLGGNSVEIGFDIAVDSSGNAYVTGETQSSDFPTASPIQSTLSGPNDTYVTKFNSSGSALVYSTYLGGSLGDDGRSIALDSSGNAYIGGDTTSSDFPTVNPLQSNNAGNADLFVTKINSAGSAYDFSTYLGSSGDERGFGVAVDSTGNVYIVGSTSSFNFPLQDPIQSSGTSGGTAVIVKLNPTGSQIKYSTYLGGNNEDRANGIAIDSANNAYVVGFTSSTDFPTFSAFQSSNGGSHDAFVVKISDNQLPTVSANGPYTVNEGSSVSVSATGNDPESGTLTYDWDLDHNGSFETPGQTVSFSAASIDGPGNRTIAVRVTDDGGLTATDEATVQVDNVAPVVEPISVTPTGNIPLGSGLSASANFTDAGVLDTHTVVWDWGDSSTDPGTVTESSGAGSVTDSHTYTSVGDYTITLTVSDGQGGTHQVSVPVTVVKQLTSLAPAQVWVGLKNSDAVGIKFDLKAEVYKDGVLVTSGQLDSVPGGSSGLGNANLNSIPFDSISPVDFPAGSSLNVKVSARNACVGSGKNSGTARLWFNDSAADSQFGATITPTASDYYLLDGFSLGTSAGPGPKKNIDVAAGAKCSPFKEFGTWSVTP